MPHKTEVQVNDVGTHYKARILNAGEDYDISDAVLTQLIFYTPSGTVTRTADITTTGSGDTAKWYLNYVSVFDDIADGLHQEPGVYQVQGYIRFSASEYFYTDIHRYVVGDNLS